LKRLIVFILIAFAIFSIVVGFSNLSMEVPITRLSTPFARSILGLPALQGRIYEIVNALENLRENLFNMVFGFGYGAEVQLLENYIPYNLRFKYILEHRAGLMHNIHNGYVSILYRTGLLGLIFFIYFQTSTLKFIFRTVKLAKSKNYKVYLILFTILIYIILSYIKFFVTYMIIGNIVFAMLLAIVMTLHQELKSN
jgi:O-antigen ligase